MTTAAIIAAWWATGIVFYFLAALIALANPWSDFGDESPLTWGDLIKWFFVGWLGPVTIIMAITEATIFLRDHKPAFLTRPVFKSRPRPRTHGLP